MTDTEPLPCPQVLAYSKSRSARAPLWERDIDEVREESLKAALAIGGEPEWVASVEEFDAHGVPVRLYRPQGDEHHVLIWLHGGGWMLGGVEASDRVARALANRATCAVLSVDYRLAPEHPFPAAIDDAWTATRWATAHFDVIAVGGDSAGGNLAAAVARRARDAEIGLALQLLVYPALESNFDTMFHKEFKRRYTAFLGRDDFGESSLAEVRYVWGVYVPDVDQRGHPDATPLRSSSFRSLAPLFLIIAEHDILRGEAEEYVRRLGLEGVPAEVVTYDGQIHGFFEMLGVMDDAQDAANRAGAALRSAFASHL